MVHRGGRDGPLRDHAELLSWLEAGDFYDAVARLRRRRQRGGGERDAGRDNQRREARPYSGGHHGPSQPNAMPSRLGT